MPEEKKEKKEKAVPFMLNPLLPVVHFDHLTITARGDGLQFLRLSTALPEGIVEQARLLVQDARLRRMIDVLCRHCNYYPTQVEKTQDKAKAKERKERSIPRKQTE